MIGISIFGFPATPDYTSDRLQIEIRSRCQPVNRPSTRLSGCSVRGARHARS